MKSILYCLYFSESCSSLGQTVYRPDRSDRTGAIRIVDLQVFAEARRDRPAETTEFSDGGRESAKGERARLTDSLCSVARQAAKSASLVKSLLLPFSLKKDYERVVHVLRFIIIKSSIILK